MSKLSKKVNICQNRSWCVQKDFIYASLQTGQFVCPSVGCFFWGEGRVCCAGKGEGVMLTTTFSNSAA